MERINNYVFELESRANKVKLKRALFCLGILSVLAWGMHVTGSIYWYRAHGGHSMRGTYGNYGWSVTLYWWGIFIGVLGPVCMILLLRSLRKNTPLLALNSHGLYINRQFIAKTLVPWDDISRIEEEQQGKVQILNIYFKSPQEIIALQSTPNQLFLKGILKNGEPFRCDSRLATGDLSSFAAKAKLYLTTSL